MSGYIALPISREPSDAQDTMTEVLRSKWPSWRADPADPMTALRDAVSVLYSDAAEIASRVAEEVFRYYGRSLADVPPVTELAATGTVTITAQDDDGPYVVPEGLELEGRNELGEPVGFRVPAQAIIPNGDTTIDVAVEALLEGTGGNDITGPAEFSEYVDYLTGVVFVGTTEGGVDEEASDDYLDRLHEELKLSSPRPILPNDFAVLARRFGAYRATVVDGLDPIAETTGNLATVTLGMVDASGVPLGGALRDSILTLLAAMREVGWQVFGVDPTVTSVDVDYAATAYPDADPVAAKVAVDAAIAGYLSGLRWGSRDGTGEARDWFNDDTVRWGEVYAVIQRIESIRLVDDLSLDGGAVGDDVTLPGYVPVPTLGTLTGAVS